MLNKMFLNLIKTITIFFSLLVITACVNDNADNENRVEQQPKPKDTLTTINHPQLEFINAEIAKDSTNADLYFNRALANQKLKNINEAIADYDKALSLNDTTSAYYLNFADLLITTNNVVPAINLLTKGLEKKPDDINMLLKLSKYYLYIDDTDKSILTANQVLKLEVSNADAYFTKGLAFVFKQDTMKAISTFQTATEQNPDFYNAFMQLGLLCAGKKMKLAEDYYKNATRINPASTEAYYGLAIYYQNNNLFQKAKDTYRKLITVDQQFKDAFYNLGYIYFNEDSLPQALKHFNMATNVDLDFTRAYYMRGLTYEALGDTANAKKDYERTVAFDPDFEMANKGLERLR